MTRRAIDVMTAWFDDRDNHEQTDFLIDRLNAYTAEPGGEDQLLGGFVNLNAMLMAAIEDFNGKTRREILRACSATLDRWDKEDPSRSRGNAKIRSAIDVMATWDDCSDTALLVSNNPMLEWLVTPDSEDPPGDLVSGFLSFTMMLLVYVIQANTGTPPRETLQQCSATLDTMENQASSPSTGE